MLDLRLTVWHIPRNHFFIFPSPFHRTSLLHSLSRLCLSVSVSPVHPSPIETFNERQPLYFPVLSISPSSHSTACDLFSFYLIWIYFSLSQCSGIYLTWSECWTAFKLTTMPSTNYKRSHAVRQKTHRLKENQYFLTDAFQIDWTREKCRTIFGVLFFLVAAAS